MYKTNVFISGLNYQLFIRVINTYIIHEFPFLLKIVLITVNKTLRQYYKKANIEE